MATQRHIVTDSPTGLIGALSLDRTAVYSLQNRGGSPVYMHEGSSTPGTDAPAVTLLPAPSLLHRDSGTNGLMEFDPPESEELYVWTEARETVELIVNAG